MWFALGAALALAQEAPAPGDLPEVDLGSADTVGTLTDEQVEFLQPKRQLLDENPYAQVDFTAYALEWGEVMLGISGIEVGVLPRVQLGTQPVFDLLGVYNLHAKGNIVRLGPLDAGLIGQWVHVPLGSFRAGFIGGGPMGSWIVTKGFSLHSGLQYGVMTASGIPDKPPALFKAWIDQEQIDELAAAAAEVGLDPKVDASALLLRLAADYRFNRRDSIVLQVNTIAWGQLDSSVGTLEVDPLVDQALALVFPYATDDFRSSTTVGPTQAYAVTVSYQASFQQIGARLGAGFSADKLSWILQGNDLNYRFWGKTRREDHRRKKGWRETNRDVRKGEEGDVPEGEE